MMRWLTVGKGGGEWTSRKTLRKFALGVSLRAAVIVFLCACLLMTLFTIMKWMDAQPQAVILLSAGLATVSSGIAGVMALHAGRTILTLRQDRERFEQLSRRDALSGLLNRRAFSEALADAGAGCTLMVMDVDRFKSINDTYGHATGDGVIIRVSALIGECLGPAVAAGRLGGEEFGVILNAPALEARMAQAEMLRAAIAREPFPVPGRVLNVTVSAGLAEIEEGRNADQVYASADKALYLAKTTGRDRIVHENQALELILDIMPDGDDDRAKAIGIV